MSSLRQHFVAANLIRGPCLLLFFLASPAWAHGPCPVTFWADNDHVCLGQTVSVTVVSENCDSLSISQYLYVASTVGTNTISGSCTNCAGDPGSGDLNIYVSAPTNLAPSSATMCPGSFMTFTLLSDPGTFPCEPTWSLSPSNAGTFTVGNQTATLTLSSAYTNATATLSSVCGTNTDSATITVNTSGTFTITTQPASVVACPGYNATFTVAATGSSLSYQWQFNGIDLTNSSRFTGCTSATLTVSNVFATTTICQEIPTDTHGGAGFGNVSEGDTYTNWAQGCTTFDADLTNLTADPNGYIYVTNCTVQVGGPTVAPSGPAFTAPGLVAWSLVGEVEADPTLYIQLGTNGTFQVPAINPHTSDLRFQLNTGNTVSPNTGSWTGCVTHTIEGAYNCIVSSSCGLVQSAPATLAVSSPCDGIPDSWRLTYFGTTNATGDMCASCYYTNSDLDNLQDYECGFDPLVPVEITTPTSVYSGWTGLVASVTASGGDITYSWSVNNGTITGGSNTTTATWTAGNAGSATLSVMLSGSPSCSATISTNITITQGYYVDYSTGNDLNNGTSPTIAWKHCPGDPTAGSIPFTTTLHPDDTVFFKSGTNYILTAANIGGGETPGIYLNWSGSNGAPITYMSTNAWGVNTNRAIITDNYSPNEIAAFCATNTAAPIHDIVFNNLEIGPIGGSATSNYNSSVVGVGWGIEGGLDYNSLANYREFYDVLVTNCYFHNIGWYGCCGSGSVGAGVTAVNSSNITVSGCLFYAMPIAAEFEAYTTRASYFTFAGNTVASNFMWAVAVVANNTGAGTSLDHVYINNNLFRDTQFRTADWILCGDDCDVHGDDVVLQAEPAGACETEGDPTTLCTNFVEGGDINVYANVFMDDDPSEGDIETSMIFFTGTTSGNVYNNLFLNPLTSDGQIDVNPDSDSQVIFTNRFYNNTSLNAAAAFLYLDTDNTQPNSGSGTMQAGQYIDIANNLNYNWTNWIAMNINAANLTTPTNRWTMNYDDWFQEGGYNSIMDWQDYGGYLSLSGLQGYNWEWQGYNADPNFISLVYTTYSGNVLLNNYGLSSTSAVLTAGRNLTSLGLTNLNVSRTGSHRVSSGAWPMGSEN